MYNGAAHSSGVHQSIRPTTVARPPAAAGVVAAVDHGRVVAVAAGGQDERAGQKAGQSEGVLSGAHGRELLEGQSDLWACSCGPAAD